MYDSYNLFGFIAIAEAAHKRLFYVATDWVGGRAVVGCVTNKVPGNISIGCTKELDAVVSKGANHIGTFLWRVTIFGPVTSHRSTGLVVLLDVFGNAFFPDTDRSILVEEVTRLTFITTSLTTRNSLKDGRVCVFTWNVNGVAACGEQA